MSGTHLSDNSHTQPIVPPCPSHRPVGWPPSWPRCPALGSRTGTAPPPAGRTAGSWGGSSCTATQRHWSGWLSQHSAVYPLLLPWASESNIYREGEWTAVQCQLLLFLERERWQRQSVLYGIQSKCFKYWEIKMKQYSVLHPFLLPKKMLEIFKTWLENIKKLTLPCMWVTKTWHTKPTLTSNLHASNKDLTWHTKPTLICMQVTKTWLDLSHKTYTNLHLNNKDLTWSDTQNLHYLACE